MKIHHRMSHETGTLAFIITDLDPQYHQAAHDTGYLPTEEGFVRELRPNPRACQPAYLDQILKNCQRSMESVFAQKAGLQPIPWEEALLRFLELVESRNIDWWLVGSGALAVRGIDVQPGDIDLCTGEDDALILQDVLLDSLIQPVQDSEGWVGKWFGRAFLGARLEWLGGINESSDASGISDFGLVAHECLETIQWHGYALRVPPLDLQLEVTLRRGLMDRAEKIFQVINSL